MSYNVIKKKIDISDMGMIRYFTPDMEGVRFYFEFISKMATTPHIEKIIKKAITIFLRPKDEKDIGTKANVWKTCLLKIV